MATARTSTHAFAVVALLGAGVVFVGCPSLADIPLGECGNGVIEEDIGEDCDAPAESPDKLEDGSHCARADEVGACHFVWDTTTCCPKGTGQGADGLCRAPSGVFSTTPALRIDEPVLGTGVSDLDGDGVLDLAIRYASREIEVRFLGPGASSEPVRDTRPSTRASRPTFGRLEAPVDPAADTCGRATAFPTGATFIPGRLGVRVLLGHRGGGLLPKAFANLDTGFPSLPLALPARSCEIDLDGIDPVLPSRLVCSGALAETPNGLNLATVDLGADAGPTPAVRTVFAGIGLDAVGFPRPQYVSMPSWEGCDGVAIRFNDKARARRNTVVILGMCGGGTGATELAALDVPAESRAFVLDADGDGNDDVVVATSAQLEVHRGDGAGDFSDVYAIPNPSLEEGAVPIAVGFLDEDLALDVVQPNLVWTSGGACADPTSCPLQLAGLLEDDTLEVAVLADVTGDGRADIVGQGRDEQGSPVLLVGAADAFGIYSFDERPTPSVPTHFTVSDFDGNGVEDVAWSLPSSTDCSEYDQVQVLYGDGGVIGDATTVAEIAGVRGMAGGLLVPSVPQLDGLGDLGITTTCPGAGAGAEHRATLVYGNQARTFDSPYALPAAGDFQEKTIFATGRIDGDDHPDLVALGYDGVQGGDEPQVPFLLWVLPASGKADLPPSSTAPRSTGLADDTSFGLVTVFTADLDCPAEGGPGCGQDDIVVFQSSGHSDASAIDDEPRLTLFPPGLDAPITTGSCGLVGSGAYADSVSDLAAGGVFSAAGAVDVDGDGLRDVVAWWYAFEAQQGLVAGDAYVFWNGPEGFAGTCPTRIEVPEGEIVASVVPTQRGKEPAQPLIVGTTAGAFRAAFGKDRRLDACATGADPGVCARVYEATGVHDVAVVDYDADGLDDLVIASGAEARVVLQVPRDEVRAATSEAADDDE